jgi:DNA-binding response OmpR family regulator
VGSANRILIIEDDRKTAAMLSLYLEHAGYRVEAVHDGEAGLLRARSGDHRAVILDLMLPGRDGREICRELRRESSVPILMLTARTTEEDRIRGLDLGADDYIAKPFSPREVVARVRAVLRRSDPAVGRDDVLRFSGLEVDLAAQQARVDGTDAGLTPTEFQILVALSGSPGRTFTRAQLVERALGPHFEGFDRTVDAHVKNLRRKIERDRARPRYVITVFGVGYRFEGDAGAA